MTALVSTATSIAGSVRAGATSPEETVAASLSRIAELDPRFGAFAVVRREAALAEAKALAERADLSTLPLAGVPVAIKDVVSVTGEPVRNGSAASDAALGTTDHAVVQRLRAAGAIVVGITHVPEACLWPTTDGPGRLTRNPWNPAMAVGGSSGGSGAAVAAGMVPIAHGTDGLGSVRIPAAMCSLVGIKPGPGVIAPVGLGTDDWMGMAEHGSLATTVADAALMLSVMAGRAELAVLGAVDIGLRIGISIKPPVLGAPLDRGVKSVVHEVAAFLADRGHHLTRADPQQPMKAVLSMIPRWTALAAAEVDAMADPSAVLPRTRTHARIGRALLRFAGDDRFDTLRAAVEQYFQRFDVLLSPTLAQDLWPVGPWSRKSWLANARIGLLGTGGFPGLWKGVGYPALSIPGGRHPRSGLPVGVQLVGRPGSESTLIALAAEWERGRPWQRTAL